MAVVPFILSETANLSILSEPLKNSSRIKYTCFNVSQNYLVFGASSGGLYVFKREPCMFVQLLPSTEGCVNLVSISPCESLVAFSTVKGLITLVGLQTTSTPRYKRTSREYEGSTITSLQWSSRGWEVYVGDSSGRISVISLIFYMGQSMFQLSHVTLMQLDSRIVQMDWHSHLLLVSTLTRCYLCDTVHQQFRQIGTQLRDGLYGACFFNVGDEDFQVASEVERETTRFSASFSSLRDGERLLSDERLRNVKVYCARPGVRLWEVRIDGTVLNTLQLKRALAIPPTPVFAFDESMEKIAPTASETSQQSFIFSKICRAVNNKFLLAFSSEGFYLLDPEKGTVVAWSDSFSGISDIKTIGDMIYVWCLDGLMHAVNVCELDTLLVRLYVQNRLQLCAELVADQEEHIAAITESSKLQFLPVLANKLREKDLAISDKALNIVNVLAENVRVFSEEKQKALKMESGIFLVGNGFSLDQYCSRQPKVYLSVDSDALVENQNAYDSNQTNGTSHSKSVFCSNPSNLRVDDDLRFSSRESSDAENSVDDLDEVFQLLGITTQEMKIALKEMGNTITGTLTNSTKSVKKSLRSVLRKQKLAWLATNDLNGSPKAFEGKSDIISTEETRPISLEEWRETPNTAINNFMAACENVSNYRATDEKSIEEYVFDLMESLVFLCDCYGSLTSKEISDIILGRRSEPTYENPSISEIFRDWLQKENSAKSVSFSQLFSEDILTQVRIHLHKSMKSGTVVAWLRKNLPNVSDERELYPVFLRSIHNEDDFVIDRILSQFLKVTASFLDPFIILQCLSVCEAPCIYLSWNQVMDLCQHGQLYKAKNLLSEGEVGDWPLPVTLNAILIMLNLKQVEYCKAAPVKDIFYTILRLESKEIKNKKSASSFSEGCGSLLMEFFDALTSAEIIKAFDDIEIKTYVLILFKELQCFQKGISCCACGYPPLFLFDRLSDLKLPYQAVCRSFIQWLKDNDQENLRDVCRNNPLLWPLALSARRTEPLVEILPLIIQMGHFLELEYRIDEMTDDLWTKTFRLCSELQGNSCLNCFAPFETLLKLSDDTANQANLSLLWQRLTELLLRKVGPAEATRLLSNNADILPPGTINKRFLKLCAISSVLDPTSGTLSRYVVENLTEAPRKIPNIPAFSLTLVQKVEKSSLTTNLLHPAANHSSSHHWGAKINLAETICPCCLLPLGSPVLLEKGGAAVFRCAHGFHAICLEKRYPSKKYTGCPLCRGKTPTSATSSGLTF